MIIFLILLMITLLILLGYYRISIHLALGTEEKSFGLRVVSFLELVGLEWIRKEKHNLFYTILFRKKTIWKKRPPRTSRTEHVPQSRLIKFKTKIKSLRTKLWMFPQTVKKLIRLTELLKVEELKIQGGFGLNDPASTGKVYAFVSALKYLGKDGTAAIVTPDFTKKTAGIRIDIRLSLILIYFLLWFFYTGTQLGLAYYKQKVK